MLQLNNGNETDFLSKAPAVEGFIELSAIRGLRRGGHDDFECLCLSFL